MNPLEGYASSTSVFPSENITFHVRTEPPHFFFQIDIYRKGREESLVHSGSGTAAAYPTPANASEIGCGWPSAYTLTIPDDWSSGVYIARLTSLGATTDILFVVKAAAPGTNSKILFQLTVTTYEAYNPWGGKSLYSDPRARKVSFNRPGYYPHFYEWEIPFITWLENNGFEVEYCSSIDLHADSDFLNNYQLVLSVGHDEYWSWAMRDNVEAFIGNGGNVAFFSGNVCWWQVRFEDDNRTMVCYKDAQEDLNENPGIDPHRVTVLWTDPRVDRRENRMTGVSFEQGAGWWDPNAGPRPPVGYRVRFSQHWIFDTTDLHDGDEFGEKDLIVGYETDAALFEENNGVPQVTGQDDTPLNFLVLATADLRDWERGGHSGPDGHSGMATMGIYRNRGTVFTAATTDWSHGLMGSWNAVSQITQNILRRLSCPCPLSPHIANCGFEKWGAWEQIGHANDVVAMAAINDKLFAATGDNKLWWREPVGQDVPWEQIGHANDVVAMAATNDKLFAATGDNKLWWREPVGQDVPWEQIGHANDVVAMAAINDKLFAATGDNKLWWREPVGQDVPWEQIGHANDVVAMAAINDKLFAATGDNKLWWREPVGQDVPWEQIGHANDVVAMAATNDKLFAATGDNKLWWREPVGLHPDRWVLEGQGRVYREEGLLMNGQYSLTIDATADETWISQGEFDCEGRNNYRVGCWAKADRPGATIRLQSTTTWRDFAIAEHSGSDEWEYLCAVGMVDDEGPMFPARVKIQVAEGVIASFDNVAVEAL